MNWKNPLAIFVFGVFVLSFYSLSGQPEADASSTMMNHEMSNSTMMNHEMSNSTMMNHEMSNSTMMNHEMSNSTMMNHEMSNSTMMNHNHMMDMNQIDAPLKQVKSGVLPHDVKCKEGYELIFKTSDNSPACVKPSAVPILVLRGWAIEETMMKMNDNSMSNDMMHTMNATNHTMNATNHTMNATNHTMNATNHTMASGMNDMHTAIDESKFQKAPALVGITGYINTTPDELPQKMKGKVILYDFWTFNCINCIHTLPYVTALDAKYADKGLLIIGIHTPETFVEKDPTNVQDAVQKFGIKYPVVLDNNYETWSAFGNHYWPRQYLVDQNGYIRYNHIGEGNYDDIEKQVQMLLAENQNT